MIITHHGLECFKVQLGDLTIALNPVSKESKAGKPARFGADIALVSLRHPDTAGVEQVSFGEKVPFVIDGPGEYEVKGVTVRGFPSVSRYGAEAGKERMNTIYAISLEGMNLVFLGALSSVELPEEATAGMGEIDILFVPVGGGGVLSAAEAEKLAVSLEPKVVIPMHYDAASLKAFLKEAGGGDTKPMEKLTVKRKDIADKEGEIVVLSEA
jgi:L-ascorbate metabolism protein UlaG (beta-lactamase superfamily)